MADTQLLEQLRDIHLPSSLPWQLAPGWYLLIGLGTILFIGLARKIIKIYLRKPSSKEIALNLINQYKAEYEQGGNAKKLSIQISELLRRVALSYFPRNQVAGLNGKPWIDFLNRTGKEVNFYSFEYALLQLPYLPNKPEETKNSSKPIKLQENKTACLPGDLSPFIKAAERWIKQQGDSRD